MKTQFAEAHRRLDRPDRRRIEVYGDESMKRGSYDLLGGLWISADNAARLRNDIRRLRVMTTAPNPEGELKWTKCSGASENPLAVSVIDLVMSRIRAGDLQFKCIVINRSLVDNDRWNDGDEELGFFKAWHTLLFSMIEAGCVYQIRLDARQLQKKHRFSDLQDVLNNRGRRDRGLDYFCCSSVEGTDSKKDDLIQVADLLTGAVGFHYSDGHTKAGASPGKIATAKRICRHLRTSNLCFGSPPWETGFNVWRWKPSRPKGH